ncbi:MULTISPECIES: endolytic transglycosylase MltG [unclassified Bacillus (in: firmicutes)]|uniref:endolytic transglycosylase MltG n=1 Tax=unclassified Bacillus (in: firmicutes) TaxID=185979 RepID=UPI0008F1E283|nr:MULTISPECIES: endolytic transglycosylase MltG [unclassified Bacillus (in: firmicutes)]SFA96136.1 hypothetical protein SAMN02799634_103143 [Bacillus sp. UNCCL13]SFQ79611.1 hypothetical protein SAMN04488577_1776 [Bacillus sp. cl95]
MNSRVIRAFALGIVFAVSILGTYYYVKDVGVSGELNEQSAKKYLEKKNFVVLTSDEYKKTQFKEKAVKKETAAKKKESPTTSSIEKPAAPVEKKPEVINYSLYIVSGMTSGEIAEVLAKQKIVANKFEFEQYLIKNNYHTEVQLGTFEVNSEMTYEEIAKVITKS